MLRDSLIVKRPRAIFRCDKIVLVVSLLTLSACTISIAEEPGSNTLEHGLQKADESFKAVEAQLLSAIRRKTDGVEAGSQQAYVFELIGKYRLVKAVPALLDQLEAQPLNPTSNYFRLTRFPAAAALVEVGSPCVARIFEYCRKDRTDRQVDLIACILATIYDDNEIAAIVVEKELTRVQSIPERKVNVDLKPLIENLQRVISYLNKKDYTNPRDWPK